MIRELKLTIREGVMVFEALEQETIRRGSERLLTALQGFPVALEGFYHQLHERINSL